jgi:hypothetical protein
VYIEASSSFRRRDSDDKRLAISLLLVARGNRAKGRRGTVVAVGTVDEDDDTVLPVRWTPAKAACSELIMVSVSKVLNALFSLRNSSLFRLSLSRRTSVATGPGCRAVIDVFGLTLNSIFPVGHVELVAGTDPFPMTLRVVLIK